MGMLAKATADLGFRQRPEDELTFQVTEVLGTAGHVWLAVRVCSGRLAVGPSPPVQKFRAARYPAVASAGLKPARPSMTRSFPRSCRRTLITSDSRKGSSHSPQPRSL